MFTIKVLEEFSGAHNLRGYEGKCEKLHGHNWKVELEITGEQLGQTGMLIDFKKAKKELNAVLELFDHKYLNEIEPFDRQNPTSENIAKYIFEKLADRLPGVSGVTVWETDTSQAKYSK